MPAGVRSTRHRPRMRQASWQGHQRCAQPDRPRARDQPATRPRLPVASGSVFPRSDDRGRPGRCRRGAGARSVRSRRGRDAARSRAPRHAAPGAPAARARSEWLRRCWDRTSWRPPPRDGRSGGASPAPCRDRRSAAIVPDGGRARIVRPADFGRRVRPPHVGQDGGERTSGQTSPNAARDSPSSIRSAGSSRRLSCPGRLTITDAAVECAYTPDTTPRPHPRVGHCATGLPVRRKGDRGMDQSKFDDLTRALAERPSRRRVLRGLAGGAAAMVGAALGREPAVAAPMPKTAKSGAPGSTGRGRRPVRRPARSAAATSTGSARRRGHSGRRPSSAARGHRMRLRRGGLLPRGDRTLLRRAGHPHVLSRGHLLRLRRSAPARRSG